jgi:hypothetical protein
VRGSVAFCPVTPSVQLPLSGSADATPAGARSSSHLGRAVLAGALHAADPEGAAAAEATRDWRSGYLPVLRRAVEAGLPSYDAALAVARDGLACLHARMVVTADGSEQPLATAELPRVAALDTVEVKGEGDRERELSLPHGGRRLRGDDLQRQLDRWVAQGTVEPSCAEAVRTVAAHPEWLDLTDLRVVALGAGAEMGPLQALLRWGGDVVAVDLPRAPLWDRVLATARAGAGRLTLPVRGAGRDDVAQRAGVDLLTETGDVADWVGALDGPLVLGNYVYADGVANLRVAAAVDALSVRLLEQRDDVSLAFLATPTDVFAVPPEAVAQARAGYDEGRVLRRLRRPLRAVSRGALLQRNYDDVVDLAGAPAGLHDSLVPQQGPNYALAKRLQRWRAAVARDAGTPVSLNIAPPTRTRSVTRNRLLAMAYAGARRFGVEVFEPATSNVLMAALLVHDLRTGGSGAGGTSRVHPYAAEARQAAHGGLWRQPYSPRSVLGLAVLVGVGGSRS